jgi:hypothetical protein
MNRNSICLLGMLALLAMALPSGLRADTFGINFDNTTGADSLGNPPFTLGWEFTLTTSIQVSSLAFYDDGENGLADSHQMGIWNSTGILLVSGSVQAGTLSPLVNQWREVTVTPTVLGPGNYFIGALFLDGNDPVWFPTQTITGFVSAPGVTYDNSTFANGSSLADPIAAGSTPGYFGANFVVSTVSTPEPSSILLLGSGLMSLVGTVSRRKLTSR